MPIPLLLLKYWREIAIGAAVLAILACVLYIKHVFRQRDELLAEKARLEQQVQLAVDTQRIMVEISDSRAAIVKRSTQYVRIIETAPAPVFGNRSTALVLIPAGVLQAVYSSSAAHVTH